MPSTPPSTPTSSLDILVVDDEIVICSLVSEILTAQGHGVQSADSAGDALVYLETNNIDLVITDVCMPRMDGLELIALIRRIYPAVHVILMSGYCPDTSRVASEELHIEGFVGKPFHLATMIAAVNAVATGVAFVG